MPFKSHLIVQEAPSHGEWILHLPLIYQTWQGEEIVVPEGFVTDLASIPWPVRQLVPHNAKERSPAVIHDYLFVIQDRPLSEANHIMMDAMIDTGTARHARWLIYAGLMVGSWVAWQRNKLLAEIDRKAFLTSNGLKP